MKLKYYLRGLGIGVLVTAIILHFILGSNEPMTDEQVKAKAKELGMIENLTLQEAQILNESVSDNQSPSSNTTELKDTVTNPDESPSESPLALASETPDVSPSAKPSETPSASPSVKPSETPSTSPSNVREISITVSGGDGSYAVAKKVQAAGLVESAADFDEYLCKNGYDKILSTGTHLIPENSTYEQIAKKLSGR